MIMCGVLSFPLITFALSLQMRAEQAGNFDGAEESFLAVSTFISVIAIIVFGVLVYTAGVNCYDYYNRRERVDLSWSLPIKNRDRFWGDFASGLVPLSLVYIVSALVGMLIINVGFPENTFRGLQEDAMTMIAAALFAGLLTIFSVYIISVFCAAICGRIYETTVYPALIIVIIPAIIGLFGTMIFNNVWQISIYEQLETILAGTSPGGFIVIFFSELLWFDGDNLIKQITFLNPAIIIPFILVNAAFLTGAYYLAKRRGAEKTGNSFVFKGSLEIIISLVVFCITSLFFISAVNSYDGLHAGIIFGLVITTAIAFLLLDVTAKRGFKKMGRAGIKYVAMLTCSIIAVNLLLAADGFGIGKYVPEQKDIASVNFNIHFLDSAQRVGYNFETVFTSPEAIALIREAQIASNNDPRNSQPDYVTFSAERAHMISMSRRQHTVTYTLKNNNTVARNIRLYTDQLEQFLPLVVSDDFKIGGLQRVNNWLSGKENIQMKADFTTFTGGFDSRAGRNVHGDILRLYEAFRVDYLAETFEQRFHSTERVLGFLSLDFEEAIVYPTDQHGSTHTRIMSRQGLGVYVFAHYTNLIAELQRQGFDLSGEIPEDERWQPPYMTIYKSDYIGAGVETSDIHRRTREEFQNIDSVWNDEIRALTEMLFDVMQPSYLMKSEGYLLQVSTGRFGATFVIPPQYSHIAEELHTLARQAQQQTQGAGYEYEEVYMYNR
jgi:hypothetical protein